jgi:hypothetical protein
VEGWRAVWWRAVLCAGVFFCTVTDTETDRQPDPSLFQSALKVYRPSDRLRLATRGQPGRTSSQTSVSCTQLVLGGVSTPTMARWSSIYSVLVCSELALSLLREDVNRLPSRRSRPVSLACQRNSAPGCCSREPLPFSMSPGTAVRRSKACRRKLLTKRYPQRSADLCTELWERSHRATGVRKRKSPQQAKKAH